MSNQVQQVVLQENRDFLLSRAPWDKPGFLQSLADKRILLKADIEDLQGKPENLIPFRIIELVGHKSHEAFNRFCDVLSKFGSESICIRLQSAYKAKLSVDPDIKKEADVLKEHLRGSTVSHPQQEVVVQAIAEKLQTERGCWQEKIDKMQSRLDVLQKRLRDVCKMMQTAISKSKSVVGQPGSTDSRGTPTSLLDIHKYTNDFVSLIEALKHENTVLATEADNLREENTNVLKRMKVLEKVRRKQTAELSKAQEELRECRAALETLESDVKEKDEKTSAEIANLIDDLNAKALEIEQLIEDKDHLILQVQNLSLKVEDLEESQGNLRIDNDAKIETLETKIEETQLQFQQQLSDIMGMMAKHSRAAPTTEHSKRPKMEAYTHDRGHIIPPGEDVPFGKPMKRSPSRKASHPSVKKTKAVVTAAAQAVEDETPRSTTATSIRAELEDSAKPSLPPITRQSSKGVKTRASGHKSRAK